MPAEYAENAEKKSSKFFCVFPRIQRAKLFGFVKTLELNYYGISNFCISKSNYEKTIVSNCFVNHLCFIGFGARYEREN